VPHARSRATTAGRQLDLARLASSLSHLNPEGVLARGYSIVQLENGAVVQDAATLGAATRRHPFSIADRPARGWSRTRED